jgi:hypothetical protein
MEQSILTWNVPNFISVCLMVALGAFLFSFVSKAIKTASAS